MSYFVPAFTQGVSLRVAIDLPGYPAPTWALEVVMVKADEQTVLTATDDGSEHIVALTPTQAGDISAGEWDYQIFVANDTDRHLVECGETTVKPDFKTATTGLDTRTALRVQIDAIEAQLAGTATAEQKRVKYGDREVERYSPEELIKALNYLRLEERRKDREQRDPRIRVRF